MTIFKLFVSDTSATPHKTVNTYTTCKARMEQLFYITGDTHPSVHSLSINYLEKKEEGKQKGIHNSEMFLSGNLIIMPHIMKVIVKVLN